MSKDENINNEIIEQYIEYCEKGKTAKVKELIKKGLNLNEKYEENIDLIDLGLTKILMAHWLCRKNSMKKARLHRCMDYLMSLNIDYSKCHLSFFVATCITCNFECSNKLIQLGFKVDDKYKNQESYYDHIFSISLDRYGKYKRSNRKDKDKKEKMKSIQYLSNCSHINYEKCNESICFIVINNQVKVLEKLILNGLDLNREVDGIKLIDKLESIAIEKKNKKMIKFLNKQKQKQEQKQEQEQEQKQE